MKFSKTERGFVAFLILVIFLFSAILYRDITRRIQSDGEEVGTVTFKNKTVQRKYQNQVIWEGVENAFPVINRDTIRTAEGADAELTLNDGTKIQLDENSMIYVDISSGKTTIGFNYGSVQADGAGDVEIQSGDSVVKLQDNTELKLAKKEDEGLLVSVSKGAADFLFGGQKKEIGKDESVFVEKDAKEITVEKIKLRSISPDNTRYITNQDQQQVSFLIAKDSAIGKVKLEVSDTASFSKILKTEELTGEGVSAGFGDGVYYWRVKAGNEISPVKKFIVIVNTAVPMIAPADNNVFNYTGQDPFINFIWRKNRVSSNYKVEVATDQGFTRIIKSETSRMNSIAFPLGEGEYYWRITANDPYGKAPAVSPVRKFVVTQKEVLAAVNLFNPQNRSVIYKSIASEKGILFNWSNSRSYMSYDLQVSSAPDFSKIIKSENIGSAFAQIRETLEPGNYYWRVRGVGLSGKKGEFTDAGTFIVKDITNLKILSPVPGEKFTNDMAVNQGVSFSWEKLPALGKYRLQIGKDATFKDARTEESVYDRVVVKNLPQGESFFKVAFLDESGKEIMSSPVAKLVITEEKDNPVLLYPVNNSAIVPLEESLNFQWVKSSMASEYLVRLYTAKGKEPLFSGKSQAANLYYAGLHDLPAGNYTWSVTGLDSSGKEGGEIRSAFSVVKSIVLIAPGRNTEFDEKKGITFKWLKLPVDGKYRIVFAEDENFRKTTDAHVTENTAILIKDIKPGKYFWKISMFNDRGQDIITSPVSSIVVKGPDDGIEKKMVRGFYPVSPPDQDVINPDKQHSMVFEFEKSFFGTSYELVIYSMQGDKLTPVMTRKLNDTKFEYTGIHDLPKGEYFWNIAAQDGSGKTVEEIFGTFYIGKNGRNYKEYEDIEVLSPTTQYGDH